MKDVFERVLDQVRQGAWRPGWVDPRESLSCGCLVQLIVRAKLDLQDTTASMDIIHHLNDVRKGLYPEPHGSITAWNDAYATQAQVEELLEAAIG